MLTSLELELLRISVALANVDKRVEISIAAKTTATIAIDGDTTSRRPFGTLTKKVNIVLRLSLNNETGSGSGSPSFNSVTDLVDAVCQHVYPRDGRRRTTTPLILTDPTTSHEPLSQR